MVSRLPPPEARWTTIGSYPWSATDRPVALAGLPMRMAPRQSPGGANCLPAAVRGGLKRSSPAITILAAF